MTTEQGNKLIAEFMGAKKRWFRFEGYSSARSVADEPSNAYAFEQDRGLYKKPNKYYQHFKWQMNDSDMSGQFDEWLAYHTSWDWLMPVVEKIVLVRCAFTLRIGNVRSWAEFEDCPPKQCEVSCIKTVWQAVVQFIQWYNSQNKQKT